MLRLPSIAIAAVLAGCGGYDGSPLCDASEIRDALASAAPGDTVRIGACTVEGSFVVPAGVTLAGEGPDTTTILGAGGNVVQLDTGAGTAAITGVTIRTTGGLAISARLEGAARVADVRIEVTGIGAGLVARNVESIEVSDVIVDGPIDDAATAAGVPIDVDADSGASHGVAITDVGRAEITQLDVSGFARFGMQVQGSRVVWTDGRIADTAGTGLMVIGGRAELTRVALERTWQVGSILPSIAGFVVGGAEVQTRALTVADNPHFGLVHSDVLAMEHTDLVARDNHHVGVWIQQPAGPPEGAFVLRNPTVENNEVAGVAAVEAPGLRIEGGRIDRTRAGPHLWGGLTGGTEIAVGAAVTSRMDPAVEMIGVSLSDNERVQIEVPFGAGDTRGLSFTDVTVSGTGTQLGAIAYGGTVVPGWDRGITRVGSTVDNDAAFDPSGLTGPFGVMNPCEMPLPDGAL